MAARGNVSYTSPVELIEQITIRADMAGRSRNEEMRQLLASAMTRIGDKEFIVELPPGKTMRGVVWLDHELRADILDRSKRFHRNLSTEIVLLMAWELQNSVDRDLAIIREMMLRADPGAPSHLSPASIAAPTSTLAQSSPAT